MNNSQNNDNLLLEENAHQLITPALKRRFQELGSQNGTDNPIIVAKYFNPMGSATWYVIEYIPEQEVCYGYVTGMAYDEFGYFTIHELESLRLPLGLKIERDLFFDETPFRDLKV
jgi:hypothetical protein